MKTSIKLTASAFLLLLSVLSALPGLSQDDYYPEKAFAVAMFPAAVESKLWLCLEQYKLGEKVSLELLNQEGQVVFNETITGRVRKRNAYRQQFDMSQLADGVYTFRISSISQKEERTFRLSTPTIQQTLPTRLIAIK